MKSILAAAVILAGAGLFAASHAGAAAKPPPEGPGPEILEGCKKLDLDTPTYMTKHYIVQAPPEYINKAVGWVKHVETNVYPTMVDVLGYTPSPDLHSVVFQGAELKHPAVYTGIGEFQKTGFKASRIYVRWSKLDAMPPWQTGGGVAWETIHALLDEAKKQADWKPIWKTEILDLIFELELYKRLNMQSEIDKLWKAWVIGKNTPYAVWAEFWKEYGWQPFQKFLKKMHENPDFKPTLDEGTFVYELSIGAGKDVSAFFETHGWKVPPETKARIAQELSHK